MQKTQEQVTMKGNPLLLAGEEVGVGDKAPDFLAVGNDLTPVRFSSLLGQGKVILLASVPSLDTSVCDLETRRFNTEFGRLGETAIGLTISMDLPFAQRRWCGAAGVQNVRTLSDHRQASFGHAYGVLIEDLRLLARAVFVIDRAGTVMYKELVREVTHEPDYSGAISAVKRLIGQ